MQTGDRCPTDKKFRKPLQLAAAACFRKAAADMRSSVLQLELYLLGDT